MAIIGTICKFAKRIHLNIFWSDLFYIFQNEDLDGYNTLLVYVSPLVPILYISFLNRLGKTSKLHEYIIIIDDTRLRRIRKNDIIFVLNPVNVAKSSKNHSCSSWLSGKSF
jgi:hypothetical protein